MAAAGGRGERPGGPASLIAALSPQSSRERASRLSGPDARPAALAAAAAAAITAAAAAAVIPAAAAAASANGAPLGYGGGGGGSIAIGVQESELFAGVNSGNGFINIAIVPEPSTWAMMLAGFAGLGWLARQRRRKLGPA